MQVGKGLYNLDIFHSTSALWISAATWKYLHDRPTADIFCTTGWRQRCYSQCTLSSNTKPYPLTVWCSTLQWPDYSTTTNSFGMENHRTPPLQRTVSSKKPSYNTALTSRLQSKFLYSYRVCENIGNDCNVSSKELSRKTKLKRCLNSYC